MRGALTALVEAYPSHVIGLESVHTASMTLARERQRVYTTSDGLIGVGYVIPRDILGDLIAFRRDCLSQMRSLKHG